MKENLQEPLHNQNKNENTENKGEMDNKKKEEKVEEINQKEKSKWDFWYGFSLFGRIIYTLYSLHGLFFIYNFIIQYIIVFPSLVYTDFISNWARIPFFLIYILFAINSSNILVIPTFEFFSFPFLYYKQPFAHIISFVTTYKQQKYNIEDAQKNHNKWSTGILIIIEFLYVWGLLSTYFGLSSTTFKDVIKMGILISIYIYYLVIIFGYICFSIYIMLIVLSKGREMFNYRKIINDYFKDKKFSNLNLFNNIINPLLTKNYSDQNNNELKESENEENCLFEDGCYKVVTFSKIFTLIFSFVCFIVIFFNLLNFWLDYVAFGFMFLIMSVLSMTLNFPFCYRNRKTYGTFGCCCDRCCDDCGCDKCCCDGCCEKGNNFIISDIKYETEVKSLHSNVVSFARLVSNVVLTAAGIVFFLIYLKNIQTTKMSTSSFKGIIPSKEKIDTKNLLMPNICYSSIYNMPLTLFLPFINDAYYYGNIKSEEGEREYKSSFEIEEYVKLFFDEDYEINVRGNLVNKADSVTMIQYNVKNKKNYLTILAIKGTSISTDMYIDAQLYVSSIFLSILSAFSLSTQKDTKTFKLIEYSLSIPYRIFFRFLIIDKYMKDLKDAYVENEYSFFNNVVIVGHSLGGGLAKLFGRFMGKQAISLSGPGINAFQSLWNYEKSSENFEISAIDLVPDMDLVPRVEVSGGTIYRIICKSGVFKCHEKEISLCETLIMCRNPIYESLCLKQTELKDNDIKKIEEGSELN